MRRSIPIKDSKSLFACYKAIASLTTKMVSTTRMGNWEVVNTLECESVTYVDVLRRSEPHPQLSRADVERKCTLLMRILEDDTHVHTTMYPHLDRLQERVNTARRVINASNACSSMAHY